MTVNEASAYLKVERTTLYGYCKRGLLPFYELRSGRGRRFKREDLDALLTLGQPGQRQETGK
jgi:excisionase family DNA binding protein